MEAKLTTGDPFEVMKARLINGPRLLSWNSDDPTWIHRARAAVTEAVGVVGEPWAAPSLDMFEETQQEGYRRIWVEFPSHEGWNGRGWLLIPDDLKEVNPAVVCLAGHGKGANAILGLAEDTYQANFGLQSVREGWVTLVVEQVSFGANRSSRDSAREASCVNDSMAALLLGESVTGWRVRDAIAAFRAVSTLPFVDSDRIGVMGISGGGLTALWSAALEPGFLAAGVSGYFCPMAHSILMVDHCPDNYVPGFAKLMDIPDLAGLIAPRWLAVENGSADPIFGADGFRAASDYAAEIYKHHNVSERFSSDLFQGDHVFNGATILKQFHLAFNDIPN